MKKGIQSAKRLHITSHQHKQPMTVRWRLRAERKNRRINKHISVISNNIEFPKVRGSHSHIVSPFKQAPHWLSRVFTPARYSCCFPQILRGAQQSALVSVVTFAFFFQLSSVGGWLRKRSQFWYRKSELSRFETVTTSGVRQDPWGANKSTKKKQRWISRQMKKIHYRCQSSIPSTFVCFGYLTLLVWSCDFASSNDGKYRSSRRRSTPRHTVVTMADKRHVLSVAFSAHRHDLYIIDSPSLNVGASATQNTCGGRHWNFHFLSNQKAAVMKSLYVFVYV